MVVVQPIRLRYSPVVPTLVSGLIAAEQKDRNAAWIERIQNPQRSAPRLYPEFPHVLVLRGSNAGRVRKSKLGTLNFQEPDHGSQLILVAFGQQIVPSEPFVRDLHLPCHRQNMHCTAYCVNGFGWWSDRVYPTPPQQILGNCSGIAAPFVSLLGLAAVPLRQRTTGGGLGRLAGASIPNCLGGRRCSLARRSLLRGPGLRQSTAGGRFGGPGRTLVSERPGGLGCRLGSGRLLVSHRHLL
jgi:hypothetical protein